MKWVVSNPPKMLIKKLFRCTYSEVRGHFSDVIDLSLDGREISPADITNLLSSLCDTVVFIDMDLEQRAEILATHFMQKRLFNKASVLKTSRYNEVMFGEMDKVVFYIDTHSCDAATWYKLNYHDNITPVIKMCAGDHVDLIGLRLALKNIDKKIYFEYDKVLPPIFHDVYRIVKLYKRKWLPFEKVRID